MIQFDLSSLPPHTAILSATLDLKYDPYNGFGTQTGENASYLQRITSDWDETTITWNHQPTYSETNQVLLPTSVDPYQDYLGIDILPLINDITLPEANNFGIAMTMINTSPYASMIFASSDNPDSTLWPKLTLTYTTVFPTYTANIVNNGTVNFVDASNNAKQWLWEFGDGATSLLKNPTHTFQSSGEYNVCLTTSDGKAKFNTCNTLSLHPAGVNNQSETGFSVYPNPSSSNFIFSKGKIREIEMLKVVDCSGKVVFSADRPKGETIIVPKLKAGMYMLMIQSESGQSQTKLIAY